MTATIETTKIVGVSVKMRLAKSSDFSIEVLKHNNGSKLISVKKPKIGQPYWLKSMHTGEFDNRNYQITEHTDWSEFKDYLRLKMVYVPLSYFELKELES